MLREMGVGDMSVGKRVKRMWEAFHGRARAYEAALAAGARTALEEALARYVWRGGPPAAAAARPPDHAGAAQPRLGGARRAAGGGGRR